MHHDERIIEETHKPALIHIYNETKGGIDSFNQLCHSYTTARKKNVGHCAFSSTCKMMLV